MWLIILSDQLPIVGLVSHYLTNYLIGRRPLFQRPKTFSLGTYAVLIRVSSGYPPLKGRLPTCYSPVRRSTEVALDLHVLSPPLAFALSQDQTLQLPYYHIGREI